MNSSSRVVANGSDTASLPGTLTSASGSGHQLVKAGTGTLLLSGNGTNLLGGINLNGGVLRLDYSSNIATKLAGGNLSLNGGTLVMAANTSTPVTQNIPGGTLLTSGHTDVFATSAGAGSITLALGAITRSVGATVDLASVANATTFTITQTTGAVNGILGAGPAFATFGGGTTWTMTG